MAQLQTFFLFVDSLMIIMPTICDNTFKPFFLSFPIPLCIIKMPAFILQLSQTLTCTCDVWGEPIVISLHFITYLFSYFDFRWIVTHQEKAKDTYSDLILT